MLAQLSPRNGDCRRHVVGLPSLKVLQIFEDARVIAGIALLVFVANRQFRADDVSAPLIDVIGRFRMRWPRICLGSDGNALMIRRAGRSENGE